MIKPGPKVHCSDAILHYNEALDWASGANGQKEDAASFFCPRSFDRAVMVAATNDCNSLVTVSMMITVRGLKEFDQLRGRRWLGKRSGERLFCPKFKPVTVIWPSRARRRAPAQRLGKHKHGARPARQRHGFRVGDSLCGLRLARAKNKCIEPP